MLLRCFAKAFYSQSRNISCIVDYTPLLPLCWEADMTYPAYRVDPGVSDTEPDYDFDNDGWED
jgi:hypothetical protein